MVVCNRRHMLSSVVNQQVWDTFETEKPVSKENGIGYTLAYLSRYPDFLYDAAKRLRAQVDGARKALNR